MSRLNPLTKPQPDKQVLANKEQEAEVRAEDYATLSVETRPLVAGCLTLAELTKMVEQRKALRR